MATNITSELHDCTFNPEAVLVAYRTDSSNYYLETRKILKNGMMGAGKPVTRKFLNGMLSHFSTTYNQTPNGMMPANMLYADTRPGSEKYIWWNPPMMRRQTFIKNLEMKDGDYPMPGVVYMVKNDELFIYAFKGKRPNDSTRLYRGPFFNYYKDCRVCLGNSKVDKPADLTWGNLQACWENLFWNSVNSHLIDENPIKGNLVTVLKEHKDKDEFPGSLLIPTQKKLKDLYR